jgi:hypothetical protein
LLGLYLVLNLVLILRALLRRRRAEPAAAPARVEDLGAALRALLARSAGQSDAGFYGALSRLIREWVGRQTGRPLRCMTPSAVARWAARDRARATDLYALSALLARADRVRFGGEPGRREEDAAEAARLAGRLAAGEGGDAV